MSGRRFEIFLAGPMPDGSPIAPGLGAAIAIEEMLHRLTLAMKGAGYSVHASAYEILPVADRSHPAATTETEPQPQGENHE